MTKLKRAVKANPSAVPRAGTARPSAEDAVTESDHSCDGHDHAHSDSESDSEIQEILAELDYIKLKEKRITPQDGEEVVAPVSLKAQLSKPRVKAVGDKLLGILGHCSLKGHIAHFYNLKFEIEKHIVSVSEFEDPRFVEAYNYLKANPSTEAVFVYENRMVAANRVNGQLVQKTIAA